MQRPRDTSAPGRRVVLIGASNLARGISTIVETAQLGWGEPVEILAALGHGRSFGQESSIFTRKISGIIQCGLWSALASAPARPTTALVTDIGNDILYGTSVNVIVGWVATCFDRLSEAGARTITGTSQVQLTVASASAMFSKPITLMESAVLTPWVGYQHLFIFGDSGVIDFTPAESALQACGPSAKCRRRRSL